MKKIIEIEGLTKNYGAHRGVNNVSFSVEEGDLFGFLGPNGAGKSTTIRSMLGFLKYETGTIRIFGQDVTKHREEVLRKIGYMPSEALFYPGMTVKETLRLAQSVRGLHCEKEAEKLCEILQLDVKRKISELSLGNRKKVSIVCAMQHKPELFIFDEPTSGLDPLMQSKFFELIESYRKEGTTCMLSTHVLPEVKNYCQNVAIMKEGNLLCAQSVEELLKTGAKRITVIRDSGKEEFLYNGEMQVLLQQLSKEAIKDLLIEDPSLEDIFMHYYEKQD